MPRTRTLRLIAWGGGGVLLGTALMALVLNVAARTRPGHEFVLQQTLEALGRDIRGTLTIDRVDGNLFEGARVYGLSLIGDDGQPFVLADSGWVDYNLRTLLSPRIVINEVILHRPRIFITRMPGDSLWNYEALFRDTSRTERPSRAERATELGKIRLRDGSVRVIMPWRPDSTAPPARQRREIAEALADTSVVIVREAGGGYVRHMYITRLNGSISDVHFAPGTEAGTSLVVDSLRARARIFRAVAEIERVRGRVALVPGRIEFDAPEVRLPASDLSMSGVVRYPEGEPDPWYDLVFHGRSVRFADLRWLYPRFPEEAEGTLSLLIETRPEGTLFLGRNVAVDAPGTRITGSFGMIAGDTLRFVEVEVEAEPVRVSVLEQMLPEGLPVRGLVVGGAEIRGEP